MQSFSSRPSSTNPPAPRSAPLANKANSNLPRNPASEFEYTQGAQEGAPHGNHLAEDWIVTAAKCVGQVVLGSAVVGALYLLSSPTKPSRPPSSTEASRTPLKVSLNVNALDVHWQHKEAFRQLLHELPNTTGASEGPGLKDSKWLRNASDLYLRIKTTQRITAEYIEQLTNSTPPTTKFPVRTEPLLPDKIQERFLAAINRTAQDPRFAALLSQKIPQEYEPREPVLLGLIVLRNELQETEKLNKEANRVGSKKGTDSWLRAPSSNP